MRAQVQGTPDAEPFGGLRADEGGSACRADRVQVGDQLRLGGDAMLEVDHQPIEADSREDLRRDR